MNGNGHGHATPADAEFERMTPAVEERKQDRAPTNGTVKPNKKPSIGTHSFFELGEDLVKRCPHYATPEGTFNASHAINSLMTLNTDGKWDKITDDNVLDAIEALRQRVAQPA